MIPTKREFDFSGPCPKLTEDGSPPTAVEERLWKANKPAFAELFRYGRDYRVPEGEWAWMQALLTNDLLRMSQLIPSNQKPTFWLILTYVQSVLPPGSYGSAEKVTTWSLGQ